MTPLWLYRLQQAFVTIIHFVLLGWIWYTLQNAGGMDTTTVMIHFTGMSILGAVLIRGTAWWARRHHLNEIKFKRRRGRNEHS